MFLLSGCLTKQPKVGDCYHTKNGKLSLQFKLFDINGDIGTFRVSILMSEKDKIKVLDSDFICQINIKNMPSDLSKLEHCYK